MAIDASGVGFEGQPVETSWNARDCMLYALGVGCGRDELQFSSEKAQQVLPTFAVLKGGGGVPLDAIGTFNFAMLVHSEQSFELFAPIPTEGSVRTVSRVTGIWDKRAAAQVETESTSTDLASGSLLFRTRSSVLIRGEGGFGGERGPIGKKNRPPKRKPELEISYETRPDQALIYRLNGDLNPLHSDPEFAALAGFDKPILHGLCTYGFTGRALLHGLCRGDPGRFRSMEGRFSRPVFPGDQLTVQMWVDEGEAIFRTCNQHEAIVLDEGRCTFER
jgi:acyl dehydratase